MPEQTIYLGSLSKVLAPGLRLGYVVAPPALFPKLLQAKQAADLHTPGFNQRIAHQVLADGLLQTHLPAVRARYQAQRDAMQSALERHLPPGCHWVRPTGGMFFWLELPAGLDSTALLPTRGGSRCGLRARRRVLRRRATRQHAAPEFCHRLAGAHRSRRRAAGHGAEAGAAVSRARSTRSTSSAPCRCAATRWPWCTRPRAWTTRRWRRWRAGPTCRKPASCCRPPTPGADYRVRIWTPVRRAAVCRPPDAGQLLGLAGGRRCAADRGRGGAAMWRGPGARAADGQRLAFAAPPLRRNGPVEPELLARACAGAGPAA